MREQFELMEDHASKTVGTEMSGIGERGRVRAKAVWVPALFVLLGCLLIQAAPAQGQRGWFPALSDDLVKSGPGVLSAFKPVADATRASIAVLAVDGWRAALGTIIDTNGFLITKASELKPGKLTCTLPGGQEVAGKVVATDDANDVALVKISTNGLKPIAWSSAETVVGQWVATPGLGSTAEAVGIVSVHPRKILPKLAQIGVDLGTNATISAVVPACGAAKAGLKAGDTILSVNGVVVNKSEEIGKLLREIREGKTAKLRVKRDNAEFDADVVMMAESTVLAARRAAQFGGPRGSGRGGRRGFGFGIDRQDQMNRMGSEVSQRAEEFDLAIQHDTVLEPWQCGGPLVNLEGKAVGLNIARAGRVASYALPASLVKRIIEDLKAQAGHSGNQN